MNQVNAKVLYKMLVEDYEIIGQKGFIDFTLKDLSIRIATRDTVGNLLQEWVKAWMKSRDIFFIENDNTQRFPDFLLNKKDQKKGLLEVKSFNGNKGPGFDIANFDSYCNSLLTESYRLNSDYLIIAYQMEGGVLTIKDVWLKKIWKISGPSGSYPVKVQDKKGTIYNLRPVTWYSERSQFKPFENLENFLSALNELRYQYPKTRHQNGRWLNNVLKNYKAHTGISLKVKS